jgi:hypothetical protein
VGVAIILELFDIQIGPMCPMPKDAEGYARYVGRCKVVTALMCKRHLRDW